MKTSIIPVLSFALLFLLNIPWSVPFFSFDYATSVIPGWHTTIYPPYFFIHIVISAILFIVTICYWKLWKKRADVNWQIFLTHFVLSIPATINLTFPGFYELFLRWDENFSVFLLLVYLIFPYLLFLCGQVLFFIYFFIESRKKTRV